MSARDRRDTRYLIRVPVEIVSRSGDVSALTDDVSFRGAFLRTDHLPPKMQLLRMRFLLPTHPAPLVLQGMGTHLVYPDDAEGRAPGVGVEMYGLEGEARRLWETFIRYVQDEYPSSDQLPVVCAPSDAVDRVHRKHVRRPAVLRVELEMKNALVSFVTEDISQGGMFIRTLLPLADGMDVNVHLVHPETQATFALECVVRRRVFGTRAGVGVQFANMTDATRAALAAFLRPVVALDDELALDTAIGDAFSMIDAHGAPHTPPTDRPDPPPTGL